MSNLSFRTPQQAPHHRGLLLAVILVAQLMVVLDATIVNVALPEIQTALGFSTSSLSWVISAYALVFGGLLLLGARTGDLLGRRPTFLAGIGLFTAASAAGGLATTSGLLLAARAAQGAGAAFAAPAALALLTTLFPEGRERLGPSATTPRSPSAAARSASWPAACSCSGRPGAGSCSSTSPSASRSC